MKQCPQCRQNFSDDTHFCLSDGTPLVSFYDAPEEVTVIRPAVNNIPPPIQPVKQGVSPIFAYLTIGLLILILVGSGVGLLIFALSRMSGTDNQPLNKDSNFNLPNVQTNFQNRNENGKSDLDEQKARLKEKQAEIERETQKLADERKKLNEQKNTIPETPVSTPPPVNYPPQPTARIKFNSGAVSQTVSGKVYTQRSFVLAARSGQYLSASVSSGGGCVTFGNNSTSTGFTTSSGDNRVTVVNNCNSEASFSLTVSIK